MEFNDYVFGDAMELMKEIPDNSVDLVFTSMPDLSQTPYDKTPQGIADYQAFQAVAVTEITRMVKPNGFVAICQTDRRVNGGVLSNHMHYAKCLEQRGLKYKDHKIVVRNEVGKKDLYHFTFQHMMLFSQKGGFKRAGEFIKDIIVDKQMMVGNQSVWSQDFCKMVIEALTKEGEFVVDPFAGVGPVLYAAKSLNRQYWGAELEEKFYNRDFEWFQNQLPV